MELDICTLINEAISNMERYWRNRDHFAYTVEYHVGHTVEEFKEAVRCGITIMRTIETGENRWVMTLEIPTTRQQREIGNAEDIDGVWQWFYALRDKYCETNNP